MNKITNLVLRSVIVAIAVIVKMIGVSISSGKESFVISVARKVTRSMNV
jgi:hypothetical protein